MFCSAIDKQILNQRICASLENVVVLHFFTVSGACVFVVVLQYFKHNQWQTDQLIEIYLENHVHLQPHKTQIDTALQTYAVTKVVQARHSNQIANSHFSRNFMWFYGHN